MICVAGCGYDTAFLLQNGYFILGAHYGEILQDALPGKYNDAFFLIYFRFEAVQYFFSFIL